MTALADFDLAAEPGQPNLGAPPPKPCRRHAWVEVRGHPYTDGNQNILAPGDLLHEMCRSCFKVRDPERSRRGKTSRRRGNDYERSVANRLGLRRVGQYGSSVDVGGAGEHMAIQVKNGVAFPKRLWRWLDALPRDAIHIRAVVVGDAPGSGQPRRELIVMDLDEFCAWFGK